MTYTPSKFPAALTVLAVPSTGLPVGTTWATVGSVTATRTGTWQVALTGTVGATVNSHGINFRILVNAAAVATGFIAANPAAQQFGLAWRGSVTSGQTIVFEGYDNTADPAAATGAMDAVFVPTPANPQ